MEPESSISVMAEADHREMPFVFEMRFFRLCRAGRGARVPVRRVVGKPMADESETPSLKAPLIRMLVRLWLCAMVSVPFCAAAQSAPAQPQTTLRTSADLVVVDVTVADAQLNPVHHLTAPDFTLLEDGKRQTLTVFEEHAADPSAALPPAPSFGPGTFTNYSDVPANGALTILLFDRLNTPMNAQTAVREQVLAYLREAPPRTRMAVFTLTTELKLLQGFTSDSELLRALVENNGDIQGASPLMNDAMNGDVPGSDDPMLNLLSQSLANTRGGSTALADLQQHAAERKSLRLQLRAKYTLEALNQLARYVANLPGRKNLIWFSGSFPISIPPDVDLENISGAGGSARGGGGRGAHSTSAFTVVASVEDEFRKTLDVLSRSQVAVYPIDARGLMGPPMSSLTDPGKSDVKDPGSFAKDNMEFSQQTSVEQGTMLEMARATGGKAFVNTNDLKEAVEKAIDSGSNYYTLAYVPANHHWNGAYRRIQVKADRPGVSLSYRRGYFADEPTAPAHRNEVAKAKSDVPRYSEIGAAMMRGGPDPTQLIFEAEVRPSSADAEPDPAPGNQAGKKISGPWRRYTVTFLTNPKAVNWTRQPDGAERFGLEFLTFVYDTDGKLINLQSSAIGGNVPADTYSSAMQHNLEYQQQISVPVKGEYYLRIGMRDSTSDRIGALELPVASVAKLPPAATGPAPAPAPK